jgi:P pilus assembly chaperone PapD
MCKKLLSILVLFIVVASNLIGCGSSPSTLTVFSITEGNVSVMKAGTASWIEAQVGMSLEPGDRVRTGDDSSAEITFSEGSTIELQTGTEIEIGSLDIPTGTDSATITLEQTIGSVIFRVTKIVDPASLYEVRTPAGVVAIRGSAMEVSVIEDGTTRVCNLEGDIWAVAQGVELQIPEGECCIIRPGQPPELIMVSAPSPVINYFAADPTSIAAGHGSTLSWSVSNATEITIDQGIGTVLLTGTRTVYPAASTTYTLQASNEAGNVTASVQITVSAPTLPIINYLTALPKSIVVGGSSMLCWNVSGAIEVTIDQGIGAVSPTGTRTVYPATSTTYTLQASNQAGNVTASVEITVSAPLPVINYFTASAYIINSGNCTHLSWSVSGATQVTIDQGIGSVGLTGTRLVCPATSTTYTLQASNQAGSVTAGIHITVVP